MSFLCFLGREIEKERIETSVGKIWALRINSIVVCIIGILLLCFSRQLGTITKCNVFVLMLFVVIASLYGSITSWFYYPWLQLPISYGLEWMTLNITLESFSW